MKILLLTNHHLGLYLFRYELVAELLKEHTVYLSLPDGELVRPLEAIGAKFIDTPIDRRGINPITDLKLFRRYRKMLSQIKPIFTQISIPEQLIFLYLLSQYAEAPPFPSARSMIRKPWNFC